MMSNKLLLASLAVLAAASGTKAFTVGTVGAPSLQLRSAAVSSRASQFVGRDATLRASLPKTRATGGMSSLSMGLFGLGWPEIAVIGVVVALIFGPSNIAGMGKDLGKLAGSLKAEASTFSEAMNESLSEAEAEFKKGEKEADEEPEPKKKSKLDAMADKPVGDKADKPVPKKKVDLSEE